MNVRYPMDSFEGHQEAHIDSFLESADGIIVVLDGKGGIQSLSKGARKILGYRDEEVHGNNVVSIVPIDRKDWMAAISKRVREDSILQDIFIHWKTKDGRRLIAKSTMRSVIDYQGAVVGMIISENLEGAAERKGEMVTSDQAMDLFLGSEIANIITDLSGNILLFNSGARALTGYAPEQIMGTSIARIFSKREVVGDLTSRTLREGKVEDFETSIADSNDRSVPVSVSLSVIRNPSGAASRLSFVIMDIAKRKELERELEIRAEKLRLVNDLATRIRSGKSLSEIYAVADEGMSPFVDFKMMTIAVVSAIDDNLMITSVEGKYPSWLSKGTDILVGKGPFVRAMNEGKPVDYARTDIEEIGGSISGDEEFESAVAIPLFAGKRFLGFLNLLSDNADAFGERELAVLAPVADHIALAVETTRLVTALMENINIQTVLMETGTALRSLIRLDEIYKTAVSKAKEVIQTDLTALYVIQDDQLNLVASDGDDSEMLPQTITKDDADLLAEFRFRSGKPLIKDVQSQKAASDWQKRHFRSLIMVKAIGIKSPIGVLVQARKIDNMPFSSYEFELMSLYMNHLSPTIENAYLFEQTKKSEIMAQAAFKAEKRTTEALDFVIDMFAHDSQNTIQGILGYLQLIRQSQLPEETLGYIEKAMRQLRADSFLVSGTSLLVKNISSDQRPTNPFNIGLSILDAKDRFSQVYPNIKVVAGFSPFSDSVGEIDTLMSVLFFHVMRLIGRTAKSDTVEISLEIDHDSLDSKVEFIIPSNRTDDKLLRTMDDNETSSLTGIRFLDPFIVRFLGEIYGARVSTRYIEGQEKDSEGRFVYTLEFSGVNESQLISNH